MSLCSTLEYFFPGRLSGPDLYVTLNMRVSQDSPTMSRAFSISGQISSTAGALPLKSFSTTPETSPGRQ